MPVPKQAPTFWSFASARMGKNPARLRSNSAKRPTSPSVIPPRGLTVSLPTILLTSQQHGRKSPGALVKNSPSRASPHNNSAMLHRKFPPAILPPQQNTATAPPPHLLPLST